MLAAKHGKNDKSTPFCPYTGGGRGIPVAVGTFARGNTTTPPVFPAPFVSPESQSEEKGFIGADFGEVDLDSNFSV